MKKIILTLFVGLIGFVSFSNSVYLSPGYTKSSRGIGAGGSSSYSVSISPYSSFVFAVGGQGINFLECYYDSGLFFTGNLAIYNNSSVSVDFNFICYNNWTSSIYPEVIKYGINNPNDFPTCTPQYTSEECQTEYGLVESGALISCETDLNSCISNTSGFNDLLNNCSNNLNACNLSLSSCLSNNCPTTSGDISWSSLFINDIQHIGGPSIYIGIPEEIERDYSYVDDDMYINVDGYNVDYDKITNIIDTQNYKPTTEDFNYIVSSLIPLFVPGLVIILFLYWIFRFIKKIF